MWAWCLRWSATQETTGPWTAIEPRIAKAYSTGFEVWKERCVSRRWKPTVMPTAVSMYMTAAIARSAGLTKRFQKRATAAIVAAKGTITAPRLAPFSMRVISAWWDEGGWSMSSTYADISAYELRFWPLLSLLSCQIDDKN